MKYLILFLLLPSLVLAGSTKTQLQVAQELRQQAKYDRSIETLIQALQENPYSPQIHLELGKSYYGRKLFESAIVSLNRALSKDAQSFDAHLYLGRSYKEKQEWGLAILAYERSLALNSEQNEARFELGRIYVQSGNFSKAKKHYRVLEKKQSPRASQLMGLIDPTSIVSQDEAQSKK